MIFVARILLTAGLAMWVVIPAASALIPETGNTTHISAFRQFKDVTGLQLVVPTVLAVPFENVAGLTRLFAVVDVTDRGFVPSLYVPNRKKISLSAEALIFPQTIINGAASLMVDGDTTTFTHFGVPASNVGEEIIRLSSVESVASSGLELTLAQYTASPSTINITAGNSERQYTVVAKRTMTGNTVRFPQTRATNWTVTFEFNQPLRIAELSILSDDTPTLDSGYLHFLAQPQHSYRVYFDPDRPVDPVQGESGNLALDNDVLRVAPSAAATNPDYALADTDSDGIPDIKDNCSAVTNPDQRDDNKNGIGDACEDFDRDGVQNIKDNCPNNPNKDQADKDADGTGDACDSIDNRITERYPWLPWAGIGSAATVLVVLFVLTAKSLTKSADQSE